ncbi:ZIP family metal transporter [Dyella sp. Tek66A03]|uniref:ZIP family metal transporter n=1 Tax=Dyella sp. Tek66A03 TaxID=3458298 RepID=UPI00403E567C
MMAAIDVWSALAASTLVAGASFAARFVVWLPQRLLSGWLPWLQASAAGLLLGDAFLHMLPEALAQGVSPGDAGRNMAIGVLGLLLIECAVRALNRQTSTATFARMDIVGDTFHHLVDGIVIGASFTVNRSLGFVVALAILAHELPREMGNAGVLVAGGYSPRRAFILSLATAAAAPVGALSVMLLSHTAIFPGMMLTLAAGTTIYLACGDVIPGLWPTLDTRQRFTPALGVMAGLAFMWTAALIERNA